MIDQSFEVLSAVLVGVLFPREHLATEAGIGQVLSEFIIMGDEYLFIEIFGVFPPILIVHDLLESLLNSDPQVAMEGDEIHNIIKQGWFAFIGNLN